MKKIFLMLGCLLPLQVQAYIHVGNLCCLYNNNNEISDNKRSFGEIYYNGSYESNYDYLSKRLKPKEKEGENKESHATITEKEKKEIGTAIQDRILAKIDLIEAKIKVLERKKNNREVTTDDYLDFLKTGGLVNLFFHTIESVKLLDNSVKLLDNNDKRLLDSNDKKKEYTYRCFCQDFVPVDRGTIHSLVDERSSRDVKYLFSLNKGVVNCFEFGNTVRLKDFRAKKNNKSGEKLCKYIVNDGVIASNLNIVNNTSEVPQQIALNEDNFANIIQALKKYIGVLNQIFSEGEVIDVNFKAPKETKNTNDNQGYYQYYKYFMEKINYYLESLKWFLGIGKKEDNLDSYCIIIQYNSKKYNIHIKTDSAEEYKEYIRLSTVMLDMEKNNKK